MQDVPRLTQPSRTLVVSLLAAALGAGVATATFALVNIEDQASVSLPSVQSVAPPSDALAGQRSDGGPQEGTAQQAMQPSYYASPAYRSSYQPASAPRGSKASANPTTGFRYDGGPNEGASADVMSNTQPPKAVAPSSQPRYDGGPDEGSSASAIAQP
jgi:hypothetical protein